MKILVAGIGNIFLGDDAFGVEVAQTLAHRPQPTGVRVVDFGIRSYDLAYALTEDYEAVILVDAVPRGNSPGTVYLLELDCVEIGRLGNEVADAHSLNPLRVLRMAESLGGSPRRLYLVGCEPEILGSDDGL